MYITFSFFSLFCILANLINRSRHLLQTTVISKKEIKIQETSIITKHLFYLLILLLVETMRYIHLLFFVVLIASCRTNTPVTKIDFADNIVVAHRGAWKTQNLPENSIASLRHAIDMHCTGSEFDVRMTADDVLIVTHDVEYNSLIIEESTYAQLSQQKLKNGEILPTLREVLLAGMKNNTTTGLVVEIKPSKTKERGQIITRKTMELIDEMGAEPYIHSFISFDYEILLKVIEINPKAKTQYLDGWKSPKKISDDAIWGLDCHMNVFKENPNWIKEAKELGLSLNVWTVNDQEDQDMFLDTDFDLITTDEPELLFKRIEESPRSRGYQLVWSDEFDYSGQPDSSKWNYAYGFIANQEEQYYTDATKNVRVEKGMLVIEAHKEKIKNEQYQDKDLMKKQWMKYTTELDSAKYTSTRLTTQDRASWTYGRIDVRAKLPKGRGIWPAIWMLGDNITEAKWPLCGEIDIMEHVGYEPDSIYGTIHTKTYNHMKGTEKEKSIFVENVSDDFHVFSLEWSPEKMDFMVDDKVYNHIENENLSIEEWPFDQNFYLILNVAVGGSWGGRKGIDDSIFPQRMEVDYVRVFQTKKEN